MKKPSLEEKDTLRVEEAIALYGLSRRKFRRLLESPRLPFVAAYGKRKIIIRPEFELYLQARPELKEELANRPRDNALPR